MIPEFVQLSRALLSAQPLTLAQQQQLVCYHSNSINTLQQATINNAIAL